MPNVAKINTNFKKSNNEPCFPLRAQNHIYKKFLIMSIFDELSFINFTITYLLFLDSICDTM